MEARPPNEILSSIKNIKFANLNVLSSRCFVSVSLFIIGFVISETSIVVAQESQLNVNTTRNNNNTTSIPLNSTEIVLGSDDKSKVVTWSETNSTEIDNTPIINIDNQKFWKFFDPLLENIN